MALTYEEIRGLNWFIADQVRDKGKFLFWFHCSAQCQKL